MPKGAQSGEKGGKEQPGVILGRRVTAVIKLKRKKKNGKGWWGRPIGIEKTKK